MTELERLLAVVAATLNKTADEVAESVKSDEGANALQTDFKTYRKAQFDDGYKAADKKLKGTVETALRKRGADAATFDDLEAALDTLDASAREKAGQKLTDEEVQKHPAVVRLLNAKDREADAKISQARTQAETELAESRAAFRQEQTQAQVEAAARQAIAALNPNLHTDPAKAARQLNRLVDDLKKGRYEVTDTGELVPIDSDGLTRKNDAGHPVKFAELVRETVLAEFDLPAATPKGTPALSQGDVNANANATPAQHFKGEWPKNEAEYLKLANDTTLPYEARKELKAHWEAAPVAG